MRILIWTPTWGDKLRPETTASVEAQEHDHDVVWMVDREQTYPPPDHHNVLASYRRARQRVLDERFDALLTVEHDMIVPRHAVQALAAGPGDVMYGLYMFRWGAYVMNAFEYVGKKNIGESLSLKPRLAKLAQKQVTTRVSGCGWGCTLIHRRVLEVIEFPQKYEQNPAFDIRFAQLCVKRDVLMMAHFGVQCGHWQGDEVLWPFQHDRVLANQSELHTFSIAVGGETLRMLMPVGSATQVRARQTVNVQVAFESKRLQKGQVYELPERTAIDLARAGYVEIVT